jgi:hypothetical protein
MKKTIAVAVFLLAVAVSDIFGQTTADVSLLNANKYFSYFPIKRNENVADNDYVWASTDEDYGRFSGLGGHPDAIDIPSNSPYFLIIPSL